MKDKKMNAVTDSIVKARVNKDIKKKAEKALASMGLTTSDLIRMTLIRVAQEQAIPFEVKVPNQTTLDAMQELKDGKGKKFKDKDALFEELDI